MTDIKLKPGSLVQSAIGQTRLDNSGAAVGAARTNPAEAYGAIPLLLQEYINTSHEKTWQEIRRRIDNVYLAVSGAMEALEAVEPFSVEIKEQIKSGKKLFFKPNLVNLPAIDPVTHAPVCIGTCLPWEFLAPVMRWFHDKQGITYHQMAVGEAGTNTPITAYNAARAFKLTQVTTQAVMEGKCGDHYGGWGFYFARKYLSECHQPGHKDDPLAGYEESLTGVCLPPGKVNDKLLIYDLNKIDASLSNGREVPVPGGINYQQITMHKMVIGGNPADPADMQNWPGCFMVNVAKLKIHVMELFTGAVKNLGIGLYPMELNTSREPGKYCWEYALPDLRIPMFKMKIPHYRWMLQYAPGTVTPLTGPDGDYVWQKTGGMESDIADIIQAVRGQGVKMLHVVDAIDAVNIAHGGPGAITIPEGLVFASHDMVAVDNCGARYLFSMLPLETVDKIQKENHLKSDVIQKVAWPEIHGRNIVSGEGYDSPLPRYGALKHCQDRGIGRETFYLTGVDLWQGGELASLHQHLGRVQKGVFHELLTANLYYTPNKPLWDFQATCFRYLELEDRLCGSNYKQQVLDALDENKDGVIEYLDTGKKDTMVVAGYNMSLTYQDLDPLVILELRFLLASTQLKRLKKEWNTTGRSIGEALLPGQALSLAYAMSRSTQENPDPFYPGRTWGRGKWPSMRLALQKQILDRLYGASFPDKFDTAMSLYGYAFRYADAACGESRSYRHQSATQNEDVIGKYHQAIRGGAARLPFTFFVPPGLGCHGPAPIPNVVETVDPQMMFTAVFNTPEGTKTWQELKLDAYGLK